MRCGVENGTDVGCVFYCCQVGEVVSTERLGFGPDQLSADKKVLSSLSGSAHQCSYKKKRKIINAEGVMTVWSLFSFTSLQVFTEPE